MVGDASSDGVKEGGGGGQESDEEEKIDPFVVLSCLLFCLGHQHQVEIKKSIFSPPKTIIAGKNLVESLGLSLCNGRGRWVIIGDPGRAITQHTPQFRRQQGAVQKIVAERG